MATQGATQGAIHGATQGQLPELEDLAEQVGEFIHYWGFKRVHGRIWTHLFLAKSPLDAAELVRRMQISKALISISLRELLEYDVILPAGRSARGTHLYKTNPDILSVILNVLRQREKRLLARVATSQGSLARLDGSEWEKFGLSADRLSALGALVSRGSGALEALISLRSVDFGEWREAFMATSEPDAGPEGHRGDDESEGESSSGSGTGPAASGSAPGNALQAGPLGTSAEGAEPFRAQGEVELFLPRGQRTLGSVALAQ